MTDIFTIAEDDIILEPNNSDMNIMGGDDEIDIDYDSFERALVFGGGSAARLFQPLAGDVRAGGTEASPPPPTRLSTADLFRFTGGGATDDLARLVDEEEKSEKEPYSGDDFSIGTVESLGGTDPDSLSIGTWN